MSLLKLPVENGIQLFIADIEGDVMGCDRLALHVARQPVILVGETQESSTLAMIEALRLHYLPRLTVSVRKSSTAGLGYEKIGDKATAYVCRGQTCMPPTNSPAKMLELLDLPEKG